jgi:hypothetical protein
MLRRMTMLVSVVVIAFVGLAVWANSIPRSQFRCRMQAPATNSWEGQYITADCDARCKLGRTWDKIRETIGKPSRDDEPGGAGAPRGIMALPVCDSGELGSLLASDSVMI